MCFGSQQVSSLTDEERKNAVKVDAIDKINILGLYFPGVFISDDLTDEKFYILAFVRDLIQ